MTHAELLGRERSTKAHGFTLWFTGLSGAGKSTLAAAVSAAGVSAPYEEPLSPELVIDTEREEVSESAARVIDRLLELGHLRSPDDA